MKWLDCDNGNKVSECGLWIAKRRDERLWTVSCIELPEVYGVGHDPDEALTVWTGMIQGKAVRLLYLVNRAMGKKVENDKKLPACIDCGAPLHLQPDGDWVCPRCGTRHSHWEICVPNGVAY